MSLLNQLRARNLPRGVHYFHDLVSKKEQEKYEEERNRLYNQQLQEEKRKEELKQLQELEQRREEAMKQEKEKDAPKDKSIVKNKSLVELMNGVLTTSNKEKYIRDNKNAFKQLSIQEQQTLFKLYSQLI